MERSLAEEAPKTESSPKKRGPEVSTEPEKAAPTGSKASADKKPGKNNPLLATAEASSKYFSNKEKKTQTKPTPEAPTCRKL